MAKSNIPFAADKQRDSLILADQFDEGDDYEVHRPQGRNDWLITFTLSGEGYFITPDREQRATPGDITLIRPGTPHRYGTVKGHRWHFVWAHFTADIGETSLLPDDVLIHQRIENTSLQQRIHHAFERVIADATERSLYWQELCQSALREIILLVAQRVHNRIDPRIQEVLYLLSTRMQESKRIDTLAQSIGLSTSRLSHLFKEHTGLSIIEALNGMRIRQAALLLKHTDRNASEAALDVGFLNYNHFINQFRKHYGMSPSAYKKG
jgi:AraC family transcriptional regulator of arabinose operon